MVSEITVVPVSYDGLDDDKRSKYAVSNLESNDEAEENLFEEQIQDEIEVIPKTTFNPKLVKAVKNLQALYNEDTNMIIEQALQEKSVCKTKFEFFY